MSTFTCTYEELKGIGAGFLKELNTLNQDELQNCLQCFNLHYLGCTYANKAEEVMVIPLVEYVNKMGLRREFELIVQGDA